MKFKELPYAGDKKVIREGDLIAFLRLDYTEGADNPLNDDDAYGSIISLSRRHTAFDKERFDANYKDPDCVILSYYEHGNCMWQVSGEWAPGTQCQWDSVGMAGLWIPNRVCKDELKLAGGKKTKPVERRKRAEELARQACEIFTAWCNGEVYDWNLDVFKVRVSNECVYEEFDDYRYDEAVLSESSSHWYLSGIKEERCLLEEINGYLKDLKPEEQNA